MAKAMHMTVGQYQRLRQANASNDVFALSKIVAEIGGELADELLKLPFPQFVKRVQALLKTVADVEPDKLPPCRDEFDLNRVTAAQMGEFYKAARIDDFTVMASTLGAARVVQDGEVPPDYMDMDALAFIGALRAFMDAVKKSVTG